ncbi:FtsP/CotA-like multicopper oxidase with cupredoxin domain [Paenibacillus endophyticus]|uniref:Copper-containing nitrite reductase n=1 Tax=Paenibacillus endophyticus TaxID=1294268 RepID=A0A7W5GAG0_9BACL|nr:multicopper oxidase family protein [Paenibacillus endophyticus]MBB3152726.1 FtsP/CotA-like multicopper oxidase with cupredoxin domain [Paenibacillus endophyticus]
MYSSLIHLELGALMLFVVFSLITAGKAAKLIYSKTEKQLNIKTRKLVFWSVCLSLLASVITGADAVLAATAHPLFWLDRLFVRTPLAVMPVLLIWFYSIPRLRKLLHRTNGRTELAPDVARRRQASDPAFIVPFQLSALCSTALFYFAFVPPIPFQWTAITIPITTLLFFACLLWMLQTRRNQLAAEAPLVYRPWRRRLTHSGVLLALLAVGSIPFLTALESSKLPERLSMMTGKADYGIAHAPSNGIALAGHHHAAVSNQPSTETAPVSVKELTGPLTGEPDRRFALTAEHKSVTLDSGEQIEAWTYNGQMPGPELRMRKGELVEVILHNKDIEDGVTLHWHGLDVPNAEDGVAGATQDAVMAGETYTYRFIAEQAGTFWYHSHQNSKTAVQKGLFGALIVEPPDASADQFEDITVITHIWEGAGMSIGDKRGIQPKKIAPGTTVKLRLIHTDDWVRQSYVLTGASFKVTAIDGTDLTGPSELHDQSLELLTGGRYDITFIMPDSPVFLRVGNGNSLGILMSKDGNGEAPIRRKTTTFDPTHYGTAATTAPFDLNSKFDREFKMVLDNRFAFFNGGFAAYDTINGEVFPNTPMFIVKEGDLVKTTIVNRSSVEHPMHLHGHHMLVLSRNNEPVTGSLWWSDTLDVAPGDSYEVAFRADNPGIWMDHCHNLVHAAAGMTMHLMYEGVVSPYEVGTATPNHPE